MVYGGGDYGHTFWFFLQWLIQQDVEPFTDDGEFGCTPEQIKEFIELGALTREGSIPPQERITQLLPLSQLASGESASEMTWDVFLAGYVADSGVENFEMLPLPSGANGTKNQFPKPSMLLSPSAGTKRPVEAAALIDFLINEPKVGEIFGTSKGVPATAA